MVNVTAGSSSSSPGMTGVMANRFGGSAAVSVATAIITLLIVVFGGLPTVVEGRPLWAAILGLVGVVAGAVLIGMAVNSMLRERRARARANAGAGAGAASRRR